MDFLFTRSGGFGTSRLDLGVFCAILIDIPHRFIGCSKCSPLESSFRRTRSGSKGGTDAKSVNGGPGLQEIKNLPLVEITTGNDARTRQASRIKLFSYIEAITEDVSTIQPYSSKGMAKGLLCSLGNLNGLITNDKFCLSRITHLHLDYCRLPDHTKQVLTVTAGYPSHKDVSSWEARAS